MAQLLTSRVARRGIIQNALDHGKIPRLAGARRIEVHDMDPLRAGPSECLGHADRVVVVDRLGSEVTLTQPDGPPGSDVDRREHREGAQRLPFVLGTPAPSMRTASRSDWATPLNDASMTWWPLRPESECKARFFCYVRTKQEV